MALTAPDDDPGIRVLRHEGPDFAWEMAFADPDPRLAGLVLRLCGYREWSPSLMRRVQPPYSGLPLIIGFGEPLRISGENYALDGVSSFVAGLDVTAAVTEGSGHQAGMQLDLTPLGAARLLGMPLASLSRQLFRFEDLIGREALQLRDRLAEANGWRRRLDLVQDFAMARIFAHRGPPPLVEAVWQHLLASSGRASIESMATYAGVSRKHLTQQFRHWTGLPPSAYARVLRFDRAVERIRAAPGNVDWALIAMDCGYYDQPHFNRDFRAFSGLSPTGFVNSLMPGGGIAASDPAG